MTLFRMFFTTMTILVSGSAFAAADMDEMLSDAIAKFRADIKEARLDIRKVAVYAIEPDSAGKVNINMVFDQVENALMETGKFAVINRKSLKALLEEQALSLTGVVDETQMVKVGKLVGAQGFFYGSVEAQKNKLILNIKLIEVESSAVVYSKKFIGESRNFSRIGISWGYLSAASGLRYEATDTAGVKIAPFESDQPLDKIGVSGPMALSLSYKQGFQALRYAMLGLDLGFASVFPRGEEGTAKGTGGFPWISIDNVQIISANLKAFLSSKEVFGWDHDWLNPYGGISFSSYTLTVRMAGGDPYEQKDLTHSVLVISPLFGLEVNATQSLSVFAEGSYALSEAMSDDGKLTYSIGDPSGPGGRNFTYSGHVPKGMTLNFGVKYYFNLF